MDSDAVGEDQLKPQTVSTSPQLPSEGAVEGSVPVSESHIHLVSFFSHYDMNIGGEPSEHDQDSVSGGRATPVSDSVAADGVDESEPATNGDSGPIDSSLEAKHEETQVRNQLHHFLSFTRTHTH